MRIHHLNGSGLLPPDFVQELEWRKGNRFVLRVVSPDSRSIPDYYCDGQRVVAVYPDGKRTTTFLEEDLNGSAGWEVSGGWILTLLAARQHLDYLWYLPKGMSVEFRYGSRAEWQGMKVRELVVRLLTPIRSAPVSYFLDPTETVLLGCETKEGQGVDAALYELQRDDPLLPTTLGDPPRP
jgi:hypothetical protein